MKPWGWTPSRNDGIWRHGASWMRPFVVCAPWISLVLLVLMFHVIGGTLTSAKGALFDLPDAGLEDGETTEMVALVMHVARETLVFFDDSRFSLGDQSSISALKDQLSERVSRADRKTLLVLADRRVAGGDIMRFASIARESGVSRVLFAEKRHVDEE